MTYFLDTSSRLARVAVVLLLSWIAGSIRSDDITEIMLQKQALISKVIDSTFASWNSTSGVAGSDRSFLTSTTSHIHNVCRKGAAIFGAARSQESRVGCCQSTERHLFNVMIEKGAFVFFRGNHSSSSSSSSSFAGSAKGGKGGLQLQLPPIISNKNGKQSEFKMHIEERAGSFPSKKCSAVFRGTLHVVGRGTAHNVYHTVSDIIMPLVGQIMRDRYIAPEYLHMPRMGLTGFHPGKGADDGVPHLQLMRDLMSAGLKPIQEADGLCVSRVIWGGGPQIIFYDSFVIMRRLSADFIRNFVIEMYQPQVPKDFFDMRTHKQTQQQTVIQQLYEPQRATAAAQLVHVSTVGKSESNISIPYYTNTNKNSSLATSANAKDTNVNSSSITVSIAGNSDKVSINLNTSIQNSTNAVATMLQSRRQRTVDNISYNNTSVSSTSSSSSKSTRLRHINSKQSRNKEAEEGRGDGEALGRPSTTSRHGSNRTHAGTMEKQQNNNRRVLSALPVPTAAHTGNKSSAVLSSLSPSSTTGGGNLLAFPNNHPLMIHGRPLNIVVYTRGSDGKGRSMKGEDALVAALRKAGAMASICCDFKKTSLVDQLAYGIYADVVMGVHGAALVHSIFSPRGSIVLELKTLYGYGSALFAMVADAHAGIHAQVDVRSYWIPGGHRAIDNPLISRVLTTLKVALVLQKEGAVEKLKEKETSGADKGDLVSGPLEITSPLDHPLGPVLSDQGLHCKQSVLQKYRELIKNDDTHCAACDHSAKRRLVEMP